MTSLQQKDTTFTKIFVGGLPYHTADDTLRRFFEPYGQIDEAVVITDRQTGKSRGYGFVTMSDRAAAERACNDPNPIIDGRKANVNLAYLGAKPRLPVGELIAAFPYGLKNNLSSYFGGAEILGMSQIVYPSAYHLTTTPAATSFSLAAAAAAAGVHHPPHLLPSSSSSSSAAAGATLLPAPTAGGQFVDYATLAAFAAAAGAGGTGDSLQALTAFPFAVQTATGTFISSAAPGSAPAYAALPYAAAAAAATNGLLPNHQTTFLGGGGGGGGGGGQLTAASFHYHPNHPLQHVHAKLQ